MPASARSWSAITRRFRPIKPCLSPCDSRTQGATFAKKLTRFGGIIYRWKLGLAQKPIGGFINAHNDRLASREPASRSLPPGGHGARPRGHDGAKDAADRRHSPSSRTSL